MIIKPIFQKKRFPFVQNVLVIPYKITVRTKIVFVDKGNMKRKPGGEKPFYRDFIKIKITNNTLDRT